MCQTEISLRVRYRMPIATGPQGRGEGGNDGGVAANGVAGGAAQWERGIPGIDALVEDLPDEFRHRFDPPMEPGAFGEVHEQQVPPPPAAAPGVAAPAGGGHGPQAADPHAMDAVPGGFDPVGQQVLQEGDMNNNRPGVDRQQNRGPGFLNRLFHRGARAPR